MVGSYPLVAAGALIVGTFLPFRAETPAASLMRVLALALAPAAACLFLLSKKWGRHRAALTIAIATTATLLFGAVMNLVLQIARGYETDILAPPTRTQLGFEFVYIAAVALAMVLLTRYARPGIRFDRAGFVAAVALLAIVSLPVWQPGPADAHAPPPLPLGHSRNLPDVYWVVLDGYGSRAALADAYGFDNAGFLASLGKLGFDVKENATSNYAQTELSLPSTLNLDYLPRMDPNATAISHAVEPAIRNSVVVRSFQEAGYDLVVLPPPTAPTNTAWPAASVKACHGLNSFEMRVLQTSLLRVFNVWAVSKQREHFECQFNTLGRLMDEPRGSRPPRFTVVHVLAPHPPFLFTAEGNPVNIATPAGPWLTGPHNGQLTYLNARLLDMLAGAASLSDSVVILQGDHGPAFPATDVAAPLGCPAPEPTLPAGAEGDETLDRHVKECKRIVTRMRILNAWHVPKGLGISVPDEASAVNTFRYVFNGLGAATEPLATSNFYSVYHRPYLFADATATLAAYGTLPNPADRTAPGMAR